MPILATLYQSGPLTFAALSQRMKASRDTLADTLANLEANGVIERQPLGRRTVFALTPRGERVGATALPMAQVVSSAGVLHLALKKWPMLVLTALGRGATRYNEAKAALPGITARALALALKDLDAAGLIERTIEAGYPPAPIYRLSETGQRFFPPLDALCCAAIPLPGEESKT